MYTCPVCLTNFNLNDNDYVELITSSNLNENGTGIITKKCPNGCVKFVIGAEPNKEDGYTLFTIDIPGSNYEAKRFIIVTDSFPLELVLREVIITPISIESVRQLLANCEFDTFWRRADTLKKAREFFKIEEVISRTIDLKIGLDFLPRLNGRTASEILVLMSNTSLTPGWVCLLIKFI